MTRYCTFSIVVVFQFFVTASSSIAGITFLPGDYNADGLVDAVDALIWEHDYGSTTNLVADGNGNGIVDQGDYDLVYENFGAFPLLTTRAFGMAAGSTENVVSLIYDPANGDLTLDPGESSPLPAFKLITTGAFNQGVVVAPFRRFVVDPNGVLPDGDMLVESTNEIGQLNLGGAPGGAFNLGPILPAGLSVGEVQAQLSGSQIFGSRGSLADFEVVEVPEPGTLGAAIALAAAIGAIRRRVSIG